MNEPTLQKIGGKVGMFFDFMCVACPCPSKNGNDGNNNDDNNNNNDSSNICQAICC